MWEQMMVALAQQVRLQVGRDQQPSLVAVDSQSVEMTQKGDLHKEWMEARRSKSANATS